LPCSEDPYIPGGFYLALPGFTIQFYPIGRAPAGDTQIESEFYRSIRFYVEANFTFPWIAGNLPNSKGTPLMGDFHLTLYKEVYIQVLWIPGINVLPQGGKKPG
jgi:hypothetical protein